MNRSHLSDDELIGLLYGLGDPERHLDGCSECGERWSEMQRALGRTRVESATEISGRRLAAQRQQVLERLNRPLSAHSWRWVPAAAAASLLAAGLVIYRPSSTLHPAPVAPVAVSAEPDAQVFTDVYSMEQDVEPRAAAPIRALFQEASFESATPAKESQDQ